MNNHSEIYSQGYEKWEGERDQAAPPWLLIGQASFKNLLSAGGCAGCLGKAVFIVGFVIHYFVIVAITVARMQIAQLKNYESLRGFAEVIESQWAGIPETAFHMHFILAPSLIFGLVAMIFYGSQLISKDKRANALQVYFSKALSRTDYVLGKFLAVAMMFSMVTLVPSALILFFGLVSTGNHMEFLAQSWYIPLITLAYWLVLTLFFGSITLFCSSCFDKSYLAGVTMIGFQVFTFIISILLIALFGVSGLLESLNLIQDVYHVGKALYNLNIASPGLFFWQVTTLAVVSGLSTLLIFRKIEPVEVVS